jgi:AAA domain
VSAAPDETKVSASVFPLNGESKLVWVSPRHRQVLKTLDAGIQDGRGVLLLLGEAGSGKTVLTRALINGLVGTGVRVGWLPSPALDLVDFRKVLGEGWLPDGEAAGGDFPEAFRRYLRDVVVQGQRVLLVIDDAQTLRPELFARTPAPAGSRSASQRRPDRDLQHPARRPERARLAAPGAPARGPGHAPQSPSAVPSGR